MLLHRWDYMAMVRVETLLVLARPFHSAYCPALTHSNWLQAEYA